MGIISPGTFFVGGVCGLALGLLALRQIRKSREPMRGRGLAIAGIVTSAIGMVVGIPFSLAVIQPELDSSRRLAQVAEAQANARKLGMTLAFVVQDRDEMFPDPEHWAEQLSEELRMDSHLLNSV